jgi:hypothetical protein
VIESHAAHFRNTFYLPKNKLLWNDKTKQHQIKCCKCPPRSAMHSFTRCFTSVAARWRVSVSWNWFTSRDVDLFGSPIEMSICLVHQSRCRFLWHRRTGNCISRLIVSSYVRTRYKAVFENEHSLHLWKRQLRISAVWRQLTDWRQQVTTWRDLRGLLYITVILCVC